MPTKRADGVPEGFEFLRRGMAAQKAVDQAVGRVVPTGEMLLRSEIARLQHLLRATTEALEDAIRCIMALGQGLEMEPQGKVLPDVVNLFEMAESARLAAREALALVRGKHA